MDQVRRAQSRSVNLYPDQWDALDNYAHEQRVSASEIVRRWLCEKLGMPLDGQSAATEAVGAELDAA
jgi:hypothetical protein